MLKRLFRRPSVKAALAWLVGSYLALALRTTRWRLAGEEHLEPIIAGAPAIAAFWHERLPLMPALWQVVRARGAGMRANVLVSRHRDGRFIGDVIRRFRVEVLYGSTGRWGQDRGGAAAQRQMLERLAAGEHVVITPDGPRGPRRCAAGGVTQLAALSGAPILPCAAQAAWRLNLPTWDRMGLPLPFGRGVLVCGPLIVVSRDGSEAALADVSAALDAAAAEADLLCR
jgi:lysophospholipid acyltransferase (LPLAT)-like uncharacterized protein